MIRKVRPGDSSVICKISCEELGYECSESLVKLHIENLDDSREAVFVKEKCGMVIGFVHVEKYATLFLRPGGTMNFPRFHIRWNCLNILPARNYNKSAD